MAFNPANDVELDWPDSEDDNEHGFDEEDDSPGEDDDAAGEEEDTEYSREEHQQPLQQLNGVSVAATYIAAEGGGGGEPLEEAPLLEEVEGDIAGDFDRLVGKYQSSQWGSAPSAASGSRQPPGLFSIDEDEDYHDMTEDGPGGSSAAAAAAHPKKTRKQRSRRPNRSTHLSHQVQHMIGEAAAAYVQRDSSKAIEICQEVIRIEPAAEAAWSTLALVHEDLDDREASVKFRIMAAHLQGDAEVWSRLGKESRNMGEIQQALYCFRKAVSLDPRDIDAIWDRSVVYSETGNTRAALSGFLSILRLTPHHTGVLLQLAPLLSSLGQYHRGITLFQSALTFFFTTLPSGPSSSSSQNPTADTELAHDILLLLITLSDFANTLGEHELAISAIRDGARWLSGRASQSFWSTVPDDREFDPPRLVGVRTGAVGLGVSDGAGAVGAGRPQGFFPLDVNLRHRLCVARLALGDLEEGKIHGDIVLQNNPLDYATCFKDIADAYFSKHLYEPALGVYTTLAAHEETSSLEIVLQIAACRRHLEDVEGCIEALKYIIELAPDNVDAKMRLAEVYEVMNKPQDALALVNQVIALRRALKVPPTNTDQIASTPTTTSAPTVPDLTISLIIPPEDRTKGKGKSSRSRLPIETVQALEEARQRPIDEGFAKIQTLNPEEEEQRVEWMKVVADLIDVFREARELFGGNRFAQFRGSVNERRLRRLESKDTDQTADDMVSRLEQDINLPKLDKEQKVNEFRKHTFEEWLELFIQYAFFSTRDGNYTVADEVLRHIIHSNAYAGFHHQTTIRLALLACATVQKEYTAILEHSRYLITVHQFNNEPLRLYLACLGGGIHAIDSFIDTNFQKFLHRDMECYRLLAEKKTEPTWNVSRNRWVFKDKGPAQKDKDAEQNDAAASDRSDNDAAATTTSAGGGGGAKPKRYVATADHANPSPKTSTKESPVLLALYGQLSASAKSYQSALFYLYQAYDLQQNDPVICLSLAVASVARAMQRQSDNRHHLVTQAMAFLERYRDVRGVGEHLAEIEYNFGRIFHQLGLFSLAAQRYELVLKEADKQALLSQKVPAVTKEAAYNLVLIYGATGGTALAKQQARKWLSF